VVVIQATRSQCYAKGQGSYPANATIINANGKFVLPGLWDSRNCTFGTKANSMLSSGVTSVIDIGLPTNCR